MPNPGPTPDWAQIPSRLRILLDTGLLDTDTPLSYVVTGSRFKVLHTSQSCPALASLKAGRLPGKAGGWRTRTAGDLAAHVTDDDTRVPADAWRNRDERTG